MIDLAAYVGATALVVAAILVIILGLRACQLLANQHAAWPYRAKIARLAHAISLDADAPDDVRQFINGMADLAFNKKFFHFIRLMPTLPADRETYSDRVRREHGERYALIVSELIVAMTFVVMFSDRRLGTLYRKVRPGLIRRDAEKIHNLRETQLKPLREKVNRNFSQTPKSAFQAA